MEDNVVKFGIKFVKVWQPSPASTEVSNSTSSLVNTGDFNIILIIGLIILACMAIGVFVWAFSKRERLTVLTHNSNTSLGFLNLVNFSLFVKIILTLISIVAIGCIFLGWFGINAYASNDEKPLVPDKTEIIAKVSGEGTITLDTCSLTNNSIDKYTVQKSNVDLSSEVSGIKDLDMSHVKILWFENQILFDGTAGPDDYVLTNPPSLDAGAQTQLTFNIDIPKNVDIESLFDKQVFTVTIKPKVSFPSHATLEEYTWPELKIVADSISNGSINQEELTKFKNFAKESQSKTVEYTLDDGRLDSLDFRILGINHDDKADNTGKAGLTFIAKNSINKIYYTGNTGDSVGMFACGWAGDGKKIFSSPMRDRMQYGGEIFNYITSDMDGVYPTQVTKLSRAGFVNEKGDYDSTIQRSKDYFFLLSGIELGTDKYDPHYVEDWEGKTYDESNNGYLANDGFPSQWRTVSWQKGPFFPNINHFGYMWLMEHLNEFDSYWEAWNAVPEDGKVPCGDINVHDRCWSRSVDYYGTSGNECWYNASYGYIADPSSLHIRLACCVEPCFCL